MIQFTCGSGFQRAGNFQQYQRAISEFLLYGSARWHDLQNAAESAYVCGGIHQQLQPLPGNNFLHYFMLINKSASLV